jgi:hypothetical protein
MDNTYLERFGSTNLDGITVIKRTDKEQEPRVEELPKK